MELRAVKVGLTGGIGSGKSTVARILQDLGASVVDADAISKAVTEVNGIALPQIMSTFGPDLVSITGVLDRDRLRDIVFQNSSAKKELEAILHPHIRREMLAKASLAAAQNSACIVFDIPLLVESGSWRNVADTIIVVDCSNETQQARVMERNGLAPDTIQRVIASQASRIVRLRASDIVLHNDDISLDQLTQNVQSIATQIGL